MIHIALMITSFFVRILDEMIISYFRANQNFQHAQFHALRYFFFLNQVSFKFKKIYSTQRVTCFAIFNFIHVIVSNANKETALQVNVKTVIT